MEDHEFIQRFTSGRLPPPGFTHEAHLRAACLLLNDRPVLEACIAMRNGLQALARAAGKPQLYHETITVAFMAIVQARLGPAGSDWRQLVAHNADLFDRDLLLAHYSPALLASEAARRAYTLPDRAGVAP